MIGLDDDVGFTVCSFEGTWNIDRNEKQCESAVFFLQKNQIS